MDLRRRSKCSGLREKFPGSHFLGRVKDGRGRRRKSLPHAKSSWNLKFPVLLNFHQTTSYKLVTKVIRTWKSGEGGSKLTDFSGGSVRFTWEMRQRWPSNRMKFHGGMVGRAGLAPYEVALVHDDRRGVLRSRDWRDTEQAWNDATQGDPWSSRNIHYSTRTRNSSRVCHPFYWSFAKRWPIADHAHSKSLSSVSHGSLMARAPRSLYFLRRPRIRSPPFRKTLSRRHHLTKRHKVDGMNCFVPFYNKRHLCSTSILRFRFFR